MDVKISVRPSRESSGCESTSGALIGASKWVGFDQGSWADWRVERQMSKVPEPPPPVEGRSSAWPAAPTAPFLSKLGGALHSAGRSAGASASPAFGAAARET